jgi:hypothetical protein
LSIEEINYFAINVETIGYNKRIPHTRYSSFCMSQRKNKKHQFKPTIDEAISQYTMNI